MSTPQLEDGFVRIANELLEAILGGSFSQRELLVLFTIIRKTYGFQKTEDDMSASQIGGLCKLARPHVTATLNQLAQRNVISKRPGRFGAIVGVQKDHRKWLPANQPKHAPASTDSVQCTDSVHVPNEYSASTDSVQVDSTDSVHTKENLSKENQQKKGESRTSKNVEKSDETLAGPKGQAMMGKTSKADRFERFFAAYPRKKSRGVAEKAFAELDPDDAMVDMMLATIERTLASGEWDDPQFIPYPGNWLSAKGWLDEATPSVPSTPKRAAGPWWETEEGMEAKGLTFDPPIVPLVGDSMATFRRRIQEAIDRNDQSTPGQEPPVYRLLVPSRPNQDLTAEQRRERLAQLKREIGIRTAGEMLQDQAGYPH